MLEFCFTQLEYYLKKIQNTDEDYVFQQARRMVREKPDWDFIAANVQEKNPYCLITIADYKETSIGTFFNTYTEYYITDITHTGTGTATYAITGKHEGNNSYILEISTGGTIGTIPYPQFELSINGGVPRTEDIPADGKIAINDATTFEFEVGGIVVLDDTYSWQTIARRVNVQKEKDIETRFRIELWAKTKKELFETDGYYDQLSKLLIERYVTDGVQVIRQSPGTSRWIQSEFEKQNDLVRGALEITYKGAIYTTTEDALVCKIQFEE